MNTVDFLAYLWTLDIQISTTNGKLRINAPKGAVTPEIQSELIDRKSEILSFLSQSEPIPAASPDSPLMLSAAQEHLWNLNRLIPNTTAYNMYSVFRLHGEINIAAFESAVNEVVERHKSLRTIFPTFTKEIPKPLVASGSSIILNKVNLLHPDEPNALQRVIDDELQFPFDLATGPLFRPTLIQINLRDHVLILVMHHIISDGHSFGILYRDIEYAYRAKLEGSRVFWNPISLEYTDYAAWQRMWLTSKASAADRNYWQNKLSGYIPKLQLPYDHTHPVYTTAEGELIDFRIKPLLSDKLHSFCRQVGVTLYIVVLTAFYALLHRHHGQEDMVVCTPAAGRDHHEFNQVIGYFNNTLLVRVNLVDIKTYRELLRSTQKVVIEALAHQMFPFKEMSNFPNLHRTSFSRAMVLVSNSNDSTFQLPGLTIDKMSIFSKAVQYDLSIEIINNQDHLGGRLMYRKALFEHETATRLIEEFISILDEITANPDSIIKSVEPVLQIETNPGQNPSRPPLSNPRNEIESRLVKIWQEVLGVDQVGIHDEFLELGGHSLLSLRLFTRIEQEMGTTLPLSSLFQSTTIANLANLIQENIDQSQWNCLVPIQAHGSKPPFFCVHGIGGGVLGYRDLVNALGEAQPFLGLQAVGQDGRESYDLSIEKMATRYINAIQSYQPNGPYRIGGYCFGGVVAYEMACQLEKMGENISLLAIFESAMSDTMDSRLSFLYRLGIFWTSIPAWIQDYSRLPLKQILKRMRFTMMKIKMKFQSNENLLRQIRIEETLDIEIENLPKNNIELTDIHIKAALNYKPQEYHGLLTLFRARHRSINEVLFGSLDPKMGWSQLAKGGVKVHLVDGYHRNMHLNPFVKSLAVALKQSLNGDP